MLNLQSLYETIITQHDIFYDNESYKLYHAIVNLLQNYQKVIKKIAVQSMHGIVIR